MATRKWQLRNAGVLLCMASQLVAQVTPEVTVAPPRAPVFLRPYKAPTVPLPRLNKPERIHALIQDGKLALTIQDAIALAIENNLDLEVERYGPLIADWQLERAQAGGLLRGVNSGSSQISQVASGQGISGSQAAAGLSTNGNTNNGGSGGAVVAQIGPVTANLDPVLQDTTLFSHRTYPQSNPVQSQTSSLVDVSHEYNTSVQQGLLTGGYVQLTASESYLKENTPTDYLNPSEAPRLSAYVQHNFLSGFGTGVNSRFIRVAKNNAAASRETFRSQLLDLVASTLNLYWDLVADHDNLSAKEKSLEIGQKFHDDTRTEIGIGSVAKVDIYRAEAELATRRQEVVVAKEAVRLQESLLKNAISRSGMEDPVLSAAEIVPMDAIHVPQSDDATPLRDMLAIAMAKRPDVAAGNTRTQNAEISALGTANGILPQLTGFAQTSNNGLSGTAQNVGGALPQPYFVGGLGNAIGQIFRRNFPSERGGGYIQAPLRNRINQGDYGVDQLQLRENALASRRDMNQILVDISNQAVALRQARARYSAAVDTRALQQDLLEKEQSKFSLGKSTFNNLIIVQRSLVAAQSVEVAALAAYAHARVGLDQTLGVTLEKNNVSLDAALSGHPLSPK